jgi:hypothetical protein
LPTNKKAAKIKLNHPTNMSKAKAKEQPAAVAQVDEQQEEEDNSGPIPIQKLEAN